MTQQNADLQELIACSAEPFSLDAIGDVGVEIERCRRLLTNIPNHPLSIVLWHRLAMLQEKIGNTQAAELAYLAALEQKSDYIPALVGYALFLEGLGRQAEAIGFLEWSPNPKDWDCALLNQRGRLYEVTGRLQEAEIELLRSLMISPDQADVVQHYTHLRAKQCRWPILVDLPNLTALQQKSRMGVMGALAFEDNPQFHFDAVMDFVRLKYEVHAKSYPHLTTARVKKPRVRLGFLSSDLRWHAVSILAVEFFELLDKSIFETFAFDFSNPEQTAFQSRVLGAFEHVVPIHHLGDREAAQTIADLQVDVLIDLNGLTSNARPIILMHKPAHLQISWLGSLTTTGIKEVDYFLCDDKVFDETCLPYFIEKPLFLKTGMHLHDSHREVGIAKPRSEYGLPENLFVFCCMNSNYKITEAIFSRWMCILKQAPNSVLWVLADSPNAGETFKSKAEMMGIDPNRIIIAQRLLPHEYLASLGAADLFLDTSPYNAGTTAVDCLFVGLPILTCPGRAVASRVAAGIVEHAGFADLNLIAKDWDEYEKRAVEFASDPGLLAKTKKRLSDPKKMASALFDAGAKARDFEVVILSALARYDERVNNEN